MYSTSAKAGHCETGLSADSGRNCEVCTRTMKLRMKRRLISELHERFINHHLGVEPMTISETRRLASRTQKVPRSRCSRVPKTVFAKVASNHMQQTEREHQSRVGSKCLKISCLGGLGGGEMYFKMYHKTEFCSCSRIDSRTNESLPLKKKTQTFPPIRKLYTTPMLTSAPKLSAEKFEYLVYMA